MTAAISSGRWVSTSERELFLGAARVARWVENFELRHGNTALSVADGALAGQADDGSHFLAHLPFVVSYDGPAEVAAFVSGLQLPADWAVLLVRKGGFAIARLHGGEVVASKVGQRHVQGRTKAGGQSQQRFARRRENQARAAYEAAAEHATALIHDAACVVVGGDPTAVEAVLAAPRLRRLADQVVPPFLTVADPRRAVLNQAIADGCSVRMTVSNA